LAVVLGALFTEVSRTAAVWQRTRGSASVKVFGPDLPPPIEPPPVDAAPMIEAFRLGYRNLEEIWKAVLPPATLVELKRMAARGADSFRMPDAVWARIVYDFVTEYLETNRVAQPNYKRAVDAFGEPGVVDLVGVCGYYMLVSMTLNVFEMPLPPGEPEPLA